MPYIMRTMTVSSPPLSDGLIISVGSSALSERPSSTPRIADLYNCLPYTTTVSSPLKAAPASRELHFCILEFQDLDC